MTRPEAEDFNRRMLAAGCHGSQSYALLLEKRVQMLEGALREIEPVAREHNVLIWTIVRAALAGTWKPMRGAFIDSSRERT